MRCSGACVWRSSRKEIVGLEQRNTCARRGLDGKISDGLIAQNSLRSKVDRMDSIARKAECWRSLSGLPTQKRGDAAWEDCVALFPVAVLTTATVNREQEVMLSSPVSLAPPKPEQSKCHELVGTHFGYAGQRFKRLRRSRVRLLEVSTTTPRVKST